MKWFEVDKEGLAKLLERRGKHFIIHELVQNAWDENTRNVRITLDPLERGRAALTVEDDNPEGFKDLSHAFTLFAESHKKSDASKRGRFNLGEKLVLALCESAVVQTTSGTVMFSAKGRRTYQQGRIAGSVFRATLKMTAAERADCEEAVKQLLPPNGIDTFFNGQQIVRRNPVTSTYDELPTEIADAEGILRRSSRRTVIDIYETLPGEPGRLYEMGIPVVETGDRWHVSIGQKVPLNMDRDNVTPAYLSRVRALVTELMYAELTTEDANAPWVREAVEHHGDKLPAKVIEHITEQRFGERRVAYDPSDPEANNLAVAAGYAVVHGGQMSRAEWDAAKRAGAIKPAGQVTPSPKPFHPDGRPLKVLDREKWTPAMAAFDVYAKRLAWELMGKQISVVIANDIGWPFAGTYGPSGILTVNAGRLGHAWFEGELEGINEFLIHEFGHEYAANHLSDEYHDALCQLGGKLSVLALRSPEIFEAFRFQVCGWGR